MSFCKTDRTDEPDRLVRAVGLVRRNGGTCLVFQRVYSKYIMPTSVHIPKPLLLAVDRRARALRISRNRLIVQVLENEMTQGSDWSADFFEQLAAPEAGTAAAAEDMLKAIQSGRRSKKPVRL